MTGTTSNILHLRDLRVQYFTLEGVVKAIDGISLEVKKGETLGIAGESGCGKSTICNSILRLIPVPGRIVGGEILFDGTNLMDLTEKRMQEIRGRKISMVFQEPIAAMDPVVKLGRQIVEVIRLHQGLSKKEAESEALKMLQLTGVEDPEYVAQTYAFRLGPGTVQQAMIAMALSCRPELLLADEPTSTMDMDTELRIVMLLKELKQKFNLSMLYITHNLGVIGQICDRVAIMYAGRIVEIGWVKNVLKHPVHPYTEALLKALVTFKR